MSIREGDDLKVNIDELCIVVCDRYRRRRGLFLTKVHPTPMSILAPYYQRQKT